MIPPPKRLSVHQALIALLGVGWITTVVMAVLTITTGNTIVTYAAGAWLGAVSVMTAVEWTDRARARA